MPHPSPSGRKLWAEGRTGLLLRPVPTSASFRDKGIRFTVQRVDGAARFHVAIETDDVEAEVRRLEAAGGQVVGRAGDWVVLRDPPGASSIPVTRFMC